jgi:hypothetical protein
MEENNTATKSMLEQILKRINEQIIVRNQQVIT